MADISKIKLPNGDEYNFKDATARANSGVTGVKGGNESNYRTGQVNLTPDNIGAAYSYNEIINGFSPEKAKGYAVKIDRLENAFYFADKRWSVTAVATDAQGNVTSLTASQISRMFDMSEHDDKLVPENGTLVVTIDFSGDSGGVFKNYPYGDVCIQFYANRNPASVTARVYGRHTGSKYYWSNLNVWGDPRNTDYANRYIIAQHGMYNMQKLEITIIGASDKNASVSQIAYYLTRADKNHDMPYVSKLREESLYYNLTAPKFIGALQGNADTATKATKDGSGNTITSYYAPKSTAVTNVALATNKITKTINGTTTDVVTAATTGAYGITKLNTATNSTSTTEAATPSAVKTAYDLANSANTTANSALSGVNGNLIYDHTFTISNGVATFTPHVYQKGTEVTSNYAASCFVWKYRLIDGSEVTLTTKSDRGCDVTISVLGYGGHIIGAFTPPE